MVWDLFGGNPIPAYLDEAWARVGLDGPPLDPSLQVIQAYERAKKTTPGFIDLTLWDGNLDTFKDFMAEQQRQKALYLQGQATPGDGDKENQPHRCLLYTSPSPRDS